METLLELTLPPKPEYVSLARLAVSLIASRMEFDVAMVDDIGVAVGEACADAIGYGRRVFTGNALLLVRCAVGSGLFVINVDLSGRRCDPPPRRHQGPFPAEDMLGKLLISALMDTISYHCTPERGMSIRMAKALPSPFTVVPNAVETDETPAVASET